MNLLFIFTGGTIGSTSDGEHICLDEDKPRGIIESYRHRFEMPFEYDTRVSHMELSENSGGEFISSTIASVCAGAAEGYDGIVVTHGTDTLSWTASALGYALGNSSVPVVIVSAAYPIEDPRSNAIENLNEAIKFITGTPRDKARGVWVSYKNSGEGALIYRATRLLRQHPFGDRVEAVGHGVFGELRELPDAIGPFGGDIRLKDNHSIVVIDPRPGYSYPVLPEGTSYIIQNTYHSGTFRTKGADVDNFYGQARLLGVPIFITGIYPGETYESTVAFKRFGALPLPEMSPVAAYMKLWMLSTVTGDRGRVKREMMMSLGGDIVPGE
ncbi:MAG: asparaginase domain-containing protein [Eubacterium sp.]|nr:asparaginase domain-containing protein [Eubacterium sp.]